MIQNVTTEDYTIEAYGTVLAPPSLQSILDKIDAAACGKSTVELSPGEARILNDYLAGF